MNKSGKTVSYIMGTDESEEPFMRDYLHLYYRMRQLRDAIIGYYLEGDIHLLVSAQYEPKGIPFICEVSFDGEKAKKYCERMNRYFEKIPSKQGEFLPRPQFAVDLTVDFGEGITEPFSFDFRGYCNEKVEDFCSKIKERGLYHYRHRIFNRLKKDNYFC